ncbi:MliC family protein [Falsochrobactrum sp. TDYN1]|uniref:MliC family protein n=1 Tax=Falsochrobactrum tianjinense TaxID=2706015 RepID=A0A949PLI6_9HYPH|nr:MliC family protein [Falsochrobactrum sp. TDYN1]MBV2142534.1 MliC family protein [Falsochrobactrum sp. TDYN1]
MKKWILLLGLSLATSTAAAGEITIALPDDVEVTVNSVLYQCGEQNIAATYHNAGDISLVELEMEDQTIVAANVISGSGARYAGGIYIWWTKGETADLYNLIEDPEQEKPVSCVEE